jgi:hypothetical protein
MQQKEFAAKQQVNTCRTCTSVACTEEVNAVQCSEVPVQCSAVKEGEMHCRAEQSRAEQCRAEQSSAVQSSAVQCSAVQCSAVQ